LKNGDWGLGIGGWGLGGGGGGGGAAPRAPTPPTPQTPIPNPQSPFIMEIAYKKFNLNLKNLNNFKKYIIVFQINY